jgi:hypothetical protein
MTVAQAKKDAVKAAEEENPGSGYDSCDIEGDKDTRIVRVFSN